MSKMSLAKTQKAEVLDPKADLAQHEAIIERGISSFIEVGNALKAIRDGREYKDRYQTFEEYCKERWGWTRQNVNRQIAGAGAALNLEPIGSKIPITERLIRPIVNLELDAQRKVWKQAIESAPDGKLTAKHVSEIASQYKSKSSAKMGHVKPDDNALLWHKISKNLRHYMSIWKYDDRHDLAEHLRHFANIVDDARKDLMR